MQPSKDLLLGRWSNVKGLVREHWNHVSEEDLTRLSGRTEELAVLLQERYGYSKPQAVVEIFKWLQEREQSSNAAPS